MATIFEHAHLWIEDCHSVDPELLAVAMNDAGVRVVVIRALEGLDIDKNVKELTQNAWFARMRTTAIQKGFRPRQLGLWFNDTAGYCDPREFADLAFALKRDLRADVCHFDLEEAWEVNKHPQKHGHAEALCKRWRYLARLAQTTICSYAYPPLAGLEWKPFVQAQFRFAPQCLYTYATYYNPSDAVKGWQAVGGKAAFVHPLIYNTDNCDLHTGLLKLKTAQLDVGFSRGYGVYLGRDPRGLDANDYAEMQKHPSLYARG